MSSRSRYTSPVHAGARFVAQRGLLKPLVWRLVTVTVLGEEHLKGLNRPFVVVSNHASHLDAPLILGSLPRRLARYLAAGAAADYFFDVWWRKGLTSLFFNAFPVDRTGLRGRHGLATSLLDDGIPLLLFPEGTRSADWGDGRVQARRCGALHQPGCALPPMAIVGASEAMPYGQNWPSRGGRRCMWHSGSRCAPRTARPSPEFSERITKEVSGLIDYATTYRANQA